ncbi:MAG TPA: flippase, partial [Longimicrobium sp.]|nr:flippase [Longimicrobium sp.]
MSIAEGAVASRPAATPCVSGPADEGTEAIGKSVARNSVLWIGQSLLLNVLSIASTGYIARKLGAVDYGLFNLGFAVLQVFAPFCALGLRAVTIRSLAENPENGRTEVGVACTLRLLTTVGAVLMALAWLALPTFTPTTRLIGLAAIFSMACQAGGRLAGDICLGYERYHLIAPFQVLGGVLLTLLSVLALLAGTGLTGFVTAYVVGGLIQLLLVLAVTWKHFGPLRPRWDRERIHDQLRQVRPFAALNLLSNATDMPTYDVLVLGMAFGDALVGPYSAAIGLVIRLMAIPTGLAAAMYPAVARRYRSQPGEVRATVQRAILNLTLVTAPMALCLSFTAPTVLWILFGNQYLSAADPLRIAAWWLPLGGINYLVRECLSAVRRQDLVLRLSVLSCVLLAVLYALLVPTLGFRGAAIAGIARELITLPLWLRALSAHFGRPVADTDVRRAGLALLLMTVPL